MARYILIDDASGFIWSDTGDLDGPARQESPVDAARRTDEHFCEFSRTYTEHGPDYRPNGAGAYHVYRADIDGSEAVSLVWDGQDQATIEDVETLCRKVAVITFAPSGE